MVGTGIYCAALSALRIFSVIEAAYSHHMSGIVPRLLICSGHETNEKPVEGNGSIGTGQVTYGQTSRPTMSIDQLCRKGLEVEG